LELFRDKSYSSEDIQDELDQIQDSASNQQPLRNRWLQLFTKPVLSARLWRAALLHFMAQMCGVTAMKYYLPSLLQSLGLDSRTSLLVGGIESSLKIGCTVVEMLLVDRLGRRNTMVGGALVMGIAMLVLSMSTSGAE
jgi:MFS family permease